MKPAAVSDIKITRDLYNGAVHNNLKGLQSQAAKLVWPKDRDTAGWPGALSLEDGGKYLIRLAGEKVPIVLEIKMIDAPSGNLGEKAVMLAKKGCNGQASSLLMSVK